MAKFSIAIIVFSLVTGLVYFAWRETKSVSSTDSDYMRVVAKTNEIRSGEVFTPDVITTRALRRRDASAQAVCNPTIPIGRQATRRLMRGETVTLSDMNPPPARFSQENVREGPLTQRELEWLKTAPVVYAADYIEPNVAVKSKQLFVREVPLPVFPEHVATRLEQVQSKTMRHQVERGNMISLYDLTVRSDVLP